MRTVWKIAMPVHAVPVQTSAPHHVHLPIGARVLHLETQHRIPTVWFDLDTDEVETCRVFQWVGAGHEVPQGGVHVGTVLLSNGNLVLHLYEVPAA